MAFLNSYIVFILKVGQDYKIGMTNDIDQVVHEHEQLNENFSLVFQKHFDEEHVARSYEEHISQLDNAKKEALIRGDDEIGVS